MRRTMISHAMAAALLGLGLAPIAADAADVVQFGHLGGPSPVTWPIHIAAAKGMFAEANVQLDMIYAQSSPAVQQQLVAGAVQMADHGVIDPIRAIVQGAKVAILASEAPVPPYTMVAKPEIKRIADLKGKPVTFGGLRDITLYYGRQMLAANGVDPKDIDIIPAGSNSSRFAAVTAGVSSAAMVTTPITFLAERQGYTNLGEVKDYVKDLPFSVFGVSLDWGLKHKDLVSRVMSAYFKAVAWFYDSANKDEAVKILQAAANISPEDSASSYDYYRKIEFFARKPDVSRRGLVNVIQVLKELGEIDQTIEPERLVSPELTRLVDSK